MPPIGVDVGRRSQFHRSGHHLKQADSPHRAKSSAVTINYGNFLQAFSTSSSSLCNLPVHQADQQTNRKKRPKRPRLRRSPADVQLLTEIRDLLKNRRPGNKILLQLITQDKTTHEDTKRENNSPFVIIQTISRPSHNVPAFSRATVIG